MTMEEPVQGPKRRRVLNYHKCSRCRADKKKCTPVDRAWPGSKCDRCEELDLECSASETASSSIRSRRNEPSIPSASERIFDTSTFEDEIDYDWLLTRSSWVRRVKHAVYDAQRFLQRLRVVQPRSPTDVENPWRLLDALEEEVRKETHHLSLQAQYLLSSRSHAIHRGTLRAMSELYVNPWIASPTESLDDSVDYDTMCQLLTTDNQRVHREDLDTLERLLVRQNDNRLLTTCSPDEYIILFAQFLNQLRRYKSPPVRPSIMPKITSLPLIGGKRLPYFFLHHASAEWRQARDLLGRTLLHVALYYDAVDDIFDIVDPQHDDVNLKDLLGNTPLHIAAIQNRPNWVDALLRHGAKPDIRGLANMTPPQVAEALGHTTVVERLAASSQATGTWRGLNASNSNDETARDTGLTMGQDSPVPSINFHEIWPDLSTPLSP